MNERLEYLQDKAGKLTLSPGVYLMKDKSGKIIYVGKAKALKNRVTSYFHNIERHNLKTYKLVEKIYDFDFIVCPTELDALVLESATIKLHNPKYNILLKDDKGYTYIRITGDEYPRIRTAFHPTDKKSTYIGPYTSGFTVNQAVDEANKIFMLPSCAKKFPAEFGKERPCLNYHIKRCMGVCRGKISSEEYQQTVKAAVEYLRSGSKESVERLTAEMEQAAEALEFERAARLRDRIKLIENADRSQQVISSKTTDFDIVAMAQNTNLASVAVIKYRGGRIVDKENFFIGDEYEPGQMRYDFLLEYYGQKQEMPKEVYVDLDIDDMELLEQFFTEKFGHKVTLIVPKRGEWLMQVTVARTNASEYLSLKVGRTAKEINALEALSKVLGLEKVPYYIESYDISNMGETTRVAGMVVYKNGRPYKPACRKFTIKETIGIDDYGCMQEVIRRRFTHYLDGDEAFSEKPDLILLDGGKGHVSAVRQVLYEMEIDVPLYGLVKDDKHRTRAIAEQGGEIQISANKSVFAFVTAIQDEVHRFSINYQRQRHTKNSYQLELTQVDGIGEAKAAAIIREYKSKAGMKRATVEELMKTAKINEETAKSLYNLIQEIF